MRRDISNNVQLARSLNLRQYRKDSIGVESIDYSINIKNMLTKLDKLEKLYGHESMDFDFIRYLPGLGKVFYQG